MLNSWHVVSTKSVKLISFALLPCLFEPAIVWFSRSSVFIICQAAWVDHFHVLCCYVRVMLLVVLDAFRWPHAVNRRSVPYLFCLSFANRASDSGDLYIDFNRNQLLLPVALLVFQVEARFNHSFPNHAYASHIASRISWHVSHHVVCALHVVDCVSLCLLF